MTRCIGVGRCDLVGDFARERFSDPRHFGQSLLAFGVHLGFRLGDLLGQSLLGGFLLGVVEALVGSVGQRVQALRARGCDLTVLLDSIEQAQAVTEVARVTGTPLPAHDLDAMYVWSSMHGLATILQSDVMSKLPVKRGVLKQAVPHAMMLVKAALSASPRLQAAGEKPAQRQARSRRPRSGSAPQSPGQCHRHHL